MSTQSLSLEEIAAKALELRQKINYEADIYGRKMEEYKRIHKKPSWSFGKLFGRKKREYKEELRAYEQGLEAIKKNYKNRNNPLNEELSLLQEKCPHDYKPWERVLTTEGHDLERRACITCSYLQERWISSKVSSSGERDYGYSVSRSVY